MGDSAQFMTDGVDSPTLNLKVSAVDRDASRVLPRAELAAHMGGHVLTRERNGQLVPERATYHVTLAVEPSPEGVAMALNHAYRGKLTIHAEWEAPVWPYLRQAVGVLVRESGF